MNTVQTHAAAFFSMIFFGCALGGVLALAVSRWLGKRLDRQHARVVALEADLAAMRGEFALARTEAQRAAERVNHLEQELAASWKRMDMLEFRRESAVFDTAIDLARRGAASDRLAAECGITQGEADLVARLHGRKKTA
jgi:outer membrane murein-binding lipoprotein Lpp